MYVCDPGLLYSSRLTLAGYVFIELTAVDPAKHRSCFHGTIGPFAVLLVTGRYDVTNCCL